MYIYRKRRYFQAYQLSIGKNVLNFANKKARKINYNQAHERMLNIFPHN